MAGPVQVPNIEEQIKTAPPKVQSLIENWQTKYGINLTSVSQESAKALDAALHRGTTPPVRQALFKVLAEQDPKKAIELEMDAYKRKGVSISDKVATEAQLMTGRIFEKPEEALAAYKRASAMVKDEVAKQQPKTHEETKAKEQPRTKSPETGPALGESKLVLERMKMFEQHVEDLDKKYGKPKNLIHFASEDRILTNPNKAADLVLKTESMSDTQSKTIDAALHNSDNQRTKIMTAVYKEAYKSASASGDMKSMQYIEHKQQQLADKLFERLSERHGDVADKFLEAPQAISFFVTYLAEEGKIGGRSSQGQKVDKRDVDNFFSLLTNPQLGGFDTKNANEVTKVCGALEKKFPELSGAASMTDEMRSQLYSKVVDFASKNKETLSDTFQYSVKNTFQISEVIATTQTINTANEQAGRMGGEIAQLETKAQEKKKV